MKFVATLGALGLFCGYSLISSAVRAIKNRRSNAKILQQPIAVKDIQDRILKLVLHDLDTKNKDLLSLSLVCKYWHNIISNGNIWTEKFNILLRIETNSTEKYEPESTEEMLRHFFGCASDLFPPKIVYYLLLPKLQYINSEEVIIPQFTTDLIRIPKQNLWTPWLNHNIMERPDTIWKFIYTAIRYPRWIYLLFVTAYTTPDAEFPFMAKHLFSSWKIHKLLLVISSFFFLPWLDIVISNTPTLSLLWDRTPWPIGTQVQAFLNLAFMQLFDNSFNFEKFVWMRAALMFVTVILSGGVRPLIYSGAMVFSAIFKLLNKDSPSWIFLLALGGIIATIIISYPIAAPLAVFMTIIAGFDTVFRTLVLSPKKMSYVRYFLLLNIGAIIWSILDK
jgi:hypothetical protein